MNKLIVICIAAAVCGCQYRGPVRHTAAPKRSVQPKAAAVQPMSAAKALPVTPLKAYSFEDELQARADFCKSNARQAYIAFCGNLALDSWRTEDWHGDRIGEKGTPACIPTAWTQKGSYRTIFADERFLSFKTDEYIDNGGPRGATRITIGTFNRKTGRLLRATDLVPASQRQKVLAAIRDCVARKVGGEKNLLGDVTLTDNCCVAGDGVHFVFNECEVADYAVGPIEVVVRKSDKSR